MLKLKILFILLITSMLFAQSDDKITLRNLYKNDFYYLKMENRLFTRSQAPEFAYDQMMRMLDLRVFIPHEDGYYYKLYPLFSKYNDAMKDINEKLYPDNWHPSMGTFEVDEIELQNWWSIYSLIANQSYTLFKYQYNSIYIIYSGNSLLQAYNFHIKQFKRSSMYKQLDNPEFVIPYSLIHILKAHMLICKMRYETDYDSFDKYKEDLEQILNYIEKDSIDYKFSFKKFFEEYDELYGYRLSLYTDMVYEMGKLAVSVDANLHETIGYWIFSDKYTSINDYAEFNNNDGIYERSEIYTQEDFSTYIENGTSLFEKYYKRFSKAIDYESYFDE